MDLTNFKVFVWGDGNPYMEHPFVSNMSSILKFLLRLEGGRYTGLIIQSADNDIDNPFFGTVRGTNYYPYIHDKSMFLGRVPCDKNADIFLDYRAFTRLPYGTNSAVSLRNIHCAIYDRRTGIFSSSVLNLLTEEFTDYYTILKDTQEVKWK